jgi:hypothetical protein
MVARAFLLKYLGWQLSISMDSILDCNFDDTAPCAQVIDPLSEVGSLFGHLLLQLFMLPSVQLLSLGALALFSKYDSQIVHTSQGI